MIEVESYLRLSDGSFLLVENVEDVPPDPYAIEGGLKLTVDGSIIIDLSMWDYVDQLWAYLSDMVLRLREDGAASSYFPDQPIKLSFERQSNGRVVVSLVADADRRFATADEYELVDALQRSGLAFFNEMKRIAPDNRDAYEVAKKRLFGDG